jgi:hypothetical protein
MQRVAPSPLTVALTIAAYVASTFLVQGASHFAINADHYAGIAIMRSKPVIPLGITAMVIQGFIFALLFPYFRNPDSPVRSGILFSLAIGAFLTSYVTLGEGGKYTVPSIPSWIVVEASVALVQFTLFGALLGLVHRRRADASVAQPA